MNGLSLLIGAIAAVVIGLGTAWLNLPQLIALPLGGAVGALLGHQEDGETTAVGFIVSAVFFLIPGWEAAAAAALAMAGYTIGRHS